MSAIIDFLNTYASTPLEQFGVAIGALAVGVLIALWMIRRWA